LSAALSTLPPPATTVASRLEARGLEKR
jgi:hypothetical protein